MTTNDFLQTYQRAGVETATPHRLVAMLYEGAIRRCGEGAAALDEKAWEAASTALLKAQAIIVELLTSLNREAGGEVAQQLAAQYDYMHRRLIEANIRRDAGAAREVAGLLGELNDAWLRIGAQSTAAPVIPGRLAVMS